MKYYLAILLLLIALLLTACMPGFGDPIGQTTSPSTTDPIPSQTDSVSTTTASVPTTTAPVPTTTVPAPTTKPTDPVPTSVPQNDAELTAFNELFQKAVGERNAYSYAIAYEYSSTAELKLRYFFDNGFPGEKEATDSEWAELKVLPGFNINYDFFRLPKDKMEADLQNCFGISLADIPDSGFEGLTYLKSTDCYYFMATGFMLNSVNFTAQSVEHKNDGTVSLTYTVGWEPTVNEYVMELKPNGDGYLILSNLKAE